MELRESFKIAAKGADARVEDTGQRKSQRALFQSSHVQ